VAEEDAGDDGARFAENLADIGGAEQGSSSHDVYIVYYSIEYIVERVERELSARAGWK
jgi:hypothetical protein